MYKMASSLNKLIILENVLITIGPHSLITLSAPIQVNTKLLGHLDKSHFLDKEGILDIQDL